MRPEFGSLFARVRRPVQLAFLYVSALFVVLWTVEPIRDRLKAIGVFDDTSLLGVLGLAVVVVAYAVGQVEDRLAMVLKAIGRFSPSHAVELVKGGVVSVYELLQRSLAGIDLKQHKSLVVLGLNLYTAWPSRIEYWLKDETTYDWDVRLFILCPHFLRQHPEWFPPSWHRRADDQIDVIRQFEREHKRDLSKRNVRLKLEEYSLFPAIHGFLLGNDDLYISYMHWSLQTGGTHVADPDQFYLRYSGDDQSQIATHARGLFSNWIDRVSRSGCSDRAHQGAAN